MSDFLLTIQDCIPETINTYFLTVRKLKAQDQGISQFFLSELSLPMGLQIVPQLLTLLD